MSFLYSHIDIYYYLFVDFLDMYVPCFFILDFIVEGVFPWALVYLQKVEQSEVEIIVATKLSRHTNSPTPYS